MFFSLAQYQLDAIVGERQSPHLTARFAARCECERTLREAAFSYAQSAQMSLTVSEEDQYSHDVRPGVGAAEEDNES